MGLEHYSTKKSNCSRTFNTINILYFEFLILSMKCCSEKNNHLEHIYYEPYTFETGASCGNHEYNFPACGDHNPHRLSSSLDVCLNSHLYRFLQQ